jgi:hypothetical protein
MRIPLFGLVKAPHYDGAKSNGKLQTAAEDLSDSIFRRPGIGK